MVSMQHSKWVGSRVKEELNKNKGWHSSKICRYLWETYATACCRGTLCRMHGSTPFAWCAFDLCCPPAGALVGGTSQTLCALLPPGQFWCSWPLRGSVGYAAEVEQGLAAHEEGSTRDGRSNVHMQGRQQSAAILDPGSSIMLLTAAAAAVPRCHVEHPVHILFQCG